MTLKALPPDARPREKLLAHGAGALADAELLALLLRTGVRGQGVLQLAQAVLQRFGGFAGLLHADAAALRGIKGLGPAKRAEVAAVFEMARRSLMQPLREAPVFTESAAVKRFLCLQMAGLGHEEFAVMYLDATHRLIEMGTLFRGTLARTAVYPREVVREALRHHAAAVILVHNHPSGVAEPSADDRWMTDQLCAALALVDVKVLDHFIVAGGKAASMVECGAM